MKTTNTTGIQFSGKTGYYVSADLLRRIKVACKIANIPWRTIAARPSTAEEFVNHVSKLSGVSIL